MTRLPRPRPVPTFKGDLVTLRPPDPVTDAQDYFEMNLEPDMHTWTGNRVLKSAFEARTELERFISMDDVSTWMIVDNPSGSVIGRFFLCWADQCGGRVVGEGNRIAKQHWRMGHNREARKLLFLYVFEDLKADVYETGAWSKNTNSIRSIEAHGFQFDREEIKWNEKYGQRLTMRFYTMTKEQWQTTVSQVLQITR